MSVHNDPIKKTSLPPTTDQSAAKVASGQEDKIKKTDEIAEKANIKGVSEKTPQSTPVDAQVSPATDSHVGPHITLPSKNVVKFDAQQFKGKFYIENYPAIGEWGGSIIMRLNGKPVPKSMEELSKLVDDCIRSPDFPLQETEQSYMPIMNVIIILARHYKLCLDVRDLRNVIDKAFINPDFEFRSESYDIKDIKKDAYQVAQRLDAQPIPKNIAELEFLLKKRQNWAEPDIDFNEAGCQLAKNAIIKHLGLK